MTVRKILIAGGALLLGMALAGNAQAQYPPYPYYPAYPYAQVPVMPPTWSYDPYTSGLGPCPQRLRPSDPPCNEQMPPTYGQPNFWPAR